MRVESDASWIPTTFLSLCDRPVHLPLPLWSSTLAQRMQELQADPESNVGALTECCNQAALLQVLSGKSDAAHAICLAQLEWIARLHARLARNDVLAFALQPWVNLGRLHRRSPDAGQSLKHFSLAVAYRERRDVALGPCLVSGADWDQIVCVDDVLPRFLWTVYIVDSFKTLAVHGDFGRARDLLAHQRPLLPGDLTALADEADILRLLAEGRFAEVGVMSSQSPTASVQEGIAFLEYEMAAYIGTRSLEQATELGEALNSLCSSGGFKTIPVIGQINLLSQLGNMHHALRDTRSTRHIFEQGLAVAIQCNDTRSRAYFERRLSEPAPADAESLHTGDPAAKSRPRIPPDTGENHVADLSRLVLAFLNSAG